MSDETFGFRLKQLRQSKGETLKGVSSALGLPLMTYAHYEYDEREPSLDLLRRLCDYYDVSADYLIGRTDEY